MCVIVDPRNLALLRASQNSRDGGTAECIAASRLSAMHGLEEHCECSEKGTVTQQEIGREKPRVLPGIVARLLSWHCKVNGVI